jgi:endonuclease YncB( thermonuclease family)
MQSSFRAFLIRWGILSLLVFLSCTTGEAAAGASKEWVKLENCTLIPNESNDGDSFHVRSGDTEYLIRLYLVDAPEIESVGAGRLVEQATYFGVSVPDVIEVGRKAKQCADEKLSKPFTVFTRMAGGLGRSHIQRFLGFVQTTDGDLGELLVFNGLARIHGTHGAPPGVTSSAEEITKLQGLEQNAKDARRGGWNIAGLATLKFESVPAPPAVTEKQTVDNVKAGKKPPGPPKKRDGEDDAAISKLDVNQATQEELERLPGVGRAMSDRIIAGRPFTSADDLQKVKGIGHGKRYDQLRPYFR